ncbi:hypothetical protein C2G38_2291839 [Gigaspora rosea]|uniref:Uncharacterized protein n=1 Tax=Gigaspora rosea TaxID=44941 RepID=A0A397VML4_9GLOM|nr:hypothetical protein C2G38_2291839 [Gigaspora rosea]
MLKRISSGDDIDGDNDMLIGQQAIFTEPPGHDMICDFRGVVFSHDLCIVNTNGDEVDIYEVPDIKPSKYPNGLHHDTMEINIGSDTERNRLISISLFGQAVHRYDRIMFSEMRKLIQDYIVSVKNQPPETRKCLMIGINVNEAFNTSVDFDITLDINWILRISVCSLSALEVMVFAILYLKKH